jgi:hypothetical protein
MLTRDQFFTPYSGLANLDAAYCLGVLENLAYTGDAGLLHLWAQAMGFPYWESIPTPHRMTPNIMVAGDATRLVIAIPGTDQFQQMVQNIIFSGQDFDLSFGIGKFHSFFLWCAQGIVPFLQNLFLSRPDLDEICFVGHSLGGAVAQLLADWVMQNTSYRVKLCVTFNCPRVGDPIWAAATRTYPSHLYFNEHDMVVELPTSVTTGASGTTNLGTYCFYYEHREQLIPITQGMNINESWYAISLAKVTEPPALGLQAFARSLTAARVVHWLHFTAKWSGIAAWVLPLPAWVLEHRMEAVLDNIPQMATFNPPAEFNNMLNVRYAIQANNTALTNPFLPVPALVIPGVFEVGAYRGGFGVADLTPPPPLHRTETIESAFQWISSPGGDVVPDLVSVDQAFFDALAAAAPSAPGQNPLLLPGPIVANVDPRPFWFQRGHDRRMLKKLRDCFNGMERQDTIRAGEEATSRISTREPIVDSEDTDLVEAFQLVRGQVDYLLALERAD